MNGKTLYRWTGVALLGVLANPGRAAPPVDGWVGPRAVNGSIVLGGPMPQWQADSDRMRGAQGIPLPGVPPTVMPSPVLPSPADTRAGPAALAGLTQTGLPEKLGTPTPVTEARRPSPDPDRLTVAAGERLSGALVRFLQASGLHLRWNARTDYVAQHSYWIAGESIDETVRAALLPHGLSGTLWEANQVLEVHAGSAEVLP